MLMTELYHLIRLLFSIVYTGNTYGGVQGNVEYVRLGNVKFNAQPQAITYQELPSYSNFSKNPTLPVHLYRALLN